MNLAPLVTHLANLDTFSGRVSAATDIESAVATVQTQASPSCVLFGVTEAADMNQYAVIGAYQHRVAVSISLLIVVRHMGDMRGASAFESLDTVRAATLQHLLGWKPTAQPQSDDYQPLGYTGGQFAWSDAGTVIWKDTFNSSYLLRKLD